MIRVRYYKLKLFLVPLVAMCSAVAGSTALPDQFRTWAGVVAAGGTALYALVNEVPHNSNDQTKPGASIE